MDLGDFYFIVLTPYLIGFAFGGLRRLRGWSHIILAVVGLTGGIIPTIINAATGSLERTLVESSGPLWLLVLCWWLLDFSVGLFAGRFMVWLYSRSLPACEHRSEYTGNCIRLFDTPDCYDTIKKSRCPKGHGPLPRREG